MKTLIIYLWLSFPIFAFPQSGTFKVTGAIKNAEKHSKAYLIYENKTDSCRIENGLFLFEGKIPEPIIGTLVIRHTEKGNLAKQADRLMVYLEPSEIRLTKSDSISKSKVINSLLNDEFMQLGQNLAKNTMEFEKKYSAYLAQPDNIKASPKYQAEAQRGFAKIASDRAAVQLAFIRANPNSFVSLAALINYAGVVPDGEAILALLKQLSPVIRQTPSGIRFNDKMKLATTLGIGNPAPDFTLPDTNGNFVALSSYRGKYVLVDFWASWCGPCRAENPRLLRTYKQYAPRGLEILGISLDKNRDKWLKAIKDDGIDWDHASDLKFTDSNVIRIYQIEAVPQNFLIGPDGKIVAKNLRGEALNEKLNELLEKI